MKLHRLLIVAMFLATAAAFARPSLAGDGSVRERMTDARAPYQSWQRGYYDPAWGMPLALVTPPTARAHTEYAWGVNGTRITPIYHQFRPSWVPPVGVYDSRAFWPAPPQPTNSNQFGVYYVRSPW
jgi:hypothetical protein